MFGIAARRTSVATSTFTPVRPGHVVDHDRQATCSRQSRGSADTGLPASACCSTASPTGSRWRRPSPGRARARRLLWCCIRPAPARIGTLPAASSARISTMRRRSGGVSVGFSPVVPQGARKWMPASICRRPRRRTAGFVEIAASGEGRDERRAGARKWRSHGSPRSICN